MLLDTGQGTVLASNAFKLGVPLHEADAIILSHGHYDHSGGLADVLRVNHPRVFAHPAALQPKFARNQDGTSRQIGIPPACERAVRERSGSLVATLSPTPVLGELCVTGPVPRVTDFEDTGGPFFLDAECSCPDPLVDDQAVLSENGWPLVTDQDGQASVPGELGRGIKNEKEHHACSPHSKDADTRCRRPAYVRRRGGHLPGYPGLFSRSRPRRGNTRIDHNFWRKEHARHAEKRHVQHANEANFASLVLNSAEPVLVDFYADWCGPCRRLAPLLEELAADMPHAVIVKVNVDHSPNLAAEYGIDSIPSVMVFKDGDVTARQVGLASKSQLRALLDR